MLSSLGTYDFTNYSNLLIKVEDAESKVSELELDIQNLEKRVVTVEEKEVDVVNNLIEGGTTKALSAEMGKQLNDQLNGSTTSRTDVFTQNDANDINYISTNNMSAKPQYERGLFYIDVSGYKNYTVNLFVKENSPIKAGLQLAADITAWSSFKYDSGWVTAGSSAEVNKSTSQTASFIRIVTTYSSTNTGKPTLEEFKNNIEIKITGFIEGVSDGTGISQRLTKTEQSILNIEKDVDTINSTLFAENSDTVVVDVSSLEEKNCSLGGNTWFLDGTKGKHKAVLVGSSNYVSIIFTSDNASTNSYVAFVTSAYTGSPTANSKIPFAGGATSRTIITQNTLTTLEVPSDAAFLILTTVDGAGYISTWDCELSNTAVTGLASLPQKMEALSIEVEKIGKVVNSAVQKQRSLELDITTGFSINTGEGVMANADYELVNYTDISDLTAIKIVTALWISSSESYDTVIEFYKSDKTLLKRYKARELYEGATPSSFAYVYTGILEVNGASFIRFCNLINIPSKNTNSSFNLVEANISSTDSIPSSMVYDDKKGKDQSVINQEQDIYNKEINSILYGGLSDAVIDVFTQNDITTEDYLSTTNGGGRGYINIPISGYDTFSIKLSISSDSIVKSALTLKETAAYGYTLYDSGWKTVGMTISINEKTDTTGKAKFIGIPFTYIDGGTGVPTLDEIKQYVTIEFEGIIVADHGLVGKIESLEKTISGIGSHYYQGEKVILDDNSFDSEIIGTLSSGTSSRQGGAIFGDHLFQFHNTLATIVVYNLKTGKNVQILNLTANSNNHAGSGGFGNEFYNSSDPFPILYISSMNEKKVYGYRITGAEGSWSIELVQTISFDFAWYIPNIAIDRENNMIVIFGYTKNSWSDSNNNLSVITSCVLPSLTDGDVTLTEFSNARKIPFIYAEQGAFARLGKLYLSYGNTISKCGMHVIDYISGITVSHAPFESIGNFEPEAFAFYESNIIMTDQNGNIYKLSF